ncbi:hypothetical protein C0995_010538 [Termitomyces sp. Mi166|nr:hypothetical protein C0995_010538 [Termitomyces sp. Mi166\
MTIENGSAAVAGCLIGLSKEPAAAFLEHQGKQLRSFVVEGYKGKGRSKALVTDSERTGAKRVFKSKDTVESYSNKEEEERVCVIKKIKCKHVKELTGAQKGNGVEELQTMVAPKMPVAGPSCSTLKPVVLVFGTSKSVPKVPVTSKTTVASKVPFAGLSTTPS